VSTKRAISTPAAPGPTIGAPYSQAIVAAELVFVSGQLPVDPATGELAGATVAEQTVQVMRNLSAVLEAAGTGLEQIVKTTVYLTTRADWPEMNNDAYKAFVGPIPPARIAVVTTELGLGALVEIDAIAHLGARQ
jgi:2-iminobutanoate/2-iminopropanoate deaminase